MLHVFGDSELIVGQVRGQHIAKNNLLKGYKYKLWDLIEVFEAFGIQVVPIEQNKEVDRFAVVGAQFGIPKDIINDQEQHVKLVVRPSIPDNQVSWQVFDSDQQIINFLQEKIEFSSNMQGHNKSLCLFFNINMFFLTNLRSLLKLVSNILVVKFFRIPV